MQSLGGSQYFQTQNAPSTSDAILALPNENLKVLVLGQASIDIDASKIVKPALLERANRIKALQSFGSATWRNVRYSKT